MDDTNPIDQPQNREVGEQMLVHTPGPWSWKSWSDGAYIVSAGDDVDDPKNMIIASRNGAPKGREAESQVNARLIAAAPELLECLRDVMACGLRKLDDRIGYDELQIDRETQKQAAELVSRFE